jgi:DNA-binding NarL/FixJ family response regulator
VSPIRVLLVDDQAIVRSGLRLALGSEDDIAVVGEATNGQHALEVARAARPDVVLMDVRMPVLDGIRATTELLAAHPSARVLVLTTFADDEYVFGALRAGASGYLLKDAEPAEILAAVRAVAAGDSVVAPAVTARLVEAALAGDPTSGRSDDPRLELLTPRELDVLSELAAGASNAEIAEALHLSEPTVKTHVSSLLGKLGLRSRVQAVVFAYESGLVTPGSSSG